jgi:hypothetical protein
MQAIRDKYVADGKAAKAAIPERFLAVDTFASSILADPAALATQYAVTPSETAPVPVNAALSASIARCEAELFAAVAAFGNISSWLQMCIPAVEDGNNFGVAIVMEGIKLIIDCKKELAVRFCPFHLDRFFLHRFCPTDIFHVLQELMKGLPDYYKERSGATEKLSPKISTSASESTSANADKETKAGEAEAASSKSGTSTSSKKDTSSSSVVPDAVAHLVALDVSWHLRVYSACEKMKAAYALVGDFLDKNERRINEPKGSGGGMSMF